MFNYYFCGQNHSTNNRHSIEISRLRKTALSQKHLSKLFSEHLWIINMILKSSLIYRQSANQNQNKTEQARLQFNNIWGVILWGSDLFQSALNSVTFTPSCWRSIWSLTPTAAQNFLSSLFTSLISNSSAPLDPVQSHIPWSFLCPTTSLSKWCLHLLCIILPQGSTGAEVLTLASRP